MIKEEQLKKIATEILKAYGEGETNASLAADCLVKADLRGISTHGTYLLIPIFDRIQAGMISIPTKIDVIKEMGAVTIMDGGNGLGQLAARRAMEISVEKAKDFGNAITSVKNTNNISFLGYYTEIASKAGMIGIAASNAAPAIAPWGSREAFIGTNPFSISIPAKNRRTILLDMSSSLVARGKIRQASRNKKSIPLNWALDTEGNPTTNPEEALKGTLLPIAGPKGSGLAIIIDILAGMLSGSKYGTEVKTFHKLEGETGVGMFCVAINIEYFLNLEEFISQVDHYIDSVKNLKKVKDVSEIYLPGEIEFLKEEKAKNEGIELALSTVEKLNDILSQIGSKLRL
ncbi:MAG: Ldh family oxidoreductase [Atribacterota bacterium]|nr:Ldh family oxidoreductase [Atribacterota bacterium]MDD5636918.1 Ldh family oxidoreductase [Atribacterota bacterium]